MRRLILIGGLALLASLPGLVYGQAKVGTAGAQFLEIGVSARAMGMGEAFLGVADDASALYYNPSGIALIEQKELMATHIEYAADIQHEFVGFVLPTPQFYGNLGLAAYWLHMADMEVTTYEHPEGSGEQFSAGDLALAGTYAASLTDNLAMGLTFKFIHSYLELEDATGWAADMGLRYNTGFRNFTLSMMLANFGPDMTFREGPDAESFPLPTDFRFGTAFDLVDRVNQKLTFGAQFSRPNDNFEKFSTGFEYWYSNFFALRVGKKFEYDYMSSGNFDADVSGFDDRKEVGFGAGMTFGGGVKLPISSYGMQVDYAYHDMGYLGAIHRFSFDFTF